MQALVPQLEERGTERFEHSVSARVDIDGTTKYRWVTSVSQVRCEPPSESRHSSQYRREVGAENALVRWHAEEWLCLRRLGVCTAQAFTGGALFAMSSGATEIYFRSCEIPILSIFAIRVVRLRPNRKAAPWRPPITPPVSRKTRNIWSRSTSSSVPLVAATTGLASCSSLVLNAQDASRR